MLCFSRRDRCALDDIPYFRHYRILCDFLVSMQETDPVYSNGERRLMEGGNTIRVIPDVQYLVQEQTWRYETYFQSSLDSFDLNVRTCELAAGPLGILTGIPTVIWFTGNDSISTLSTSDQNLLQAYLSSGGHLLLGQEVCHLYDGTATGAQQTVRRDGRSDSGLPVPSGVYVYRLNAGSSRIARTLHILR